MYQIIFNKISAAEMGALPRILQMELLAALEELPEKPETGKDDHLKVFEREGRQLIRVRAKDHRIYLERTAEGVLVHRVLHRNSLGDFLFRTGLPAMDEDAAESGRLIWQLVEEGERSGHK